MTPLVGILHLILKAHKSAKNNDHMSLIAADE